MSWKNHVCLKDIDDEAFWLPGTDPGWLIKVCWWLGQYRVQRIKSAAIDEHIRCGSEENQGLKGNSTEDEIGAGSWATVDREGCESWPAIVSTCIQPLFLHRGI